MTRLPILSAAILVAAAMAAFALSALPELLGAHPWWAQKVVLVGGAAGLAVAMLGARAIPGKALRIALGASVLLLAMAAAHWGRLEFAASYAENALAGRCWYFGWITASGALSALLTTLLAR